MIVAGPIFFVAAMFQIFIGVAADSWWPLLGALFCGVIFILCAGAVD